MRTTNFIVLFFLVIAGMIVKLDNQQTMMQTATRLKMEYSRSIDSAIDDTVRSIVESVDATANINLEEVKEKYFTSLYASMGALSSPTEQEMLRVHTPALAVVERDGCSVLYHSVGEKSIAMQWSPKYYYTYDGPAYSVNFTLGDEVTVTIDGLDTVFRGRWDSLLEKYPEVDDYNNTINSSNQLLHLYYEMMQPFQSAEEFEKYRRSTITSTIVENVNYYVNRHNEVAAAYGISYSFTLPESFADTAARAIDDVSVLSVFQGYPLGRGTSERYSKYSLGGARIHKSTGYWVAMSKTGVNYYHRESCGLKGATTVVYDTREECAKRGAYPCPFCKP